MLRLYQTVSDCGEIGEVFCEKPKNKAHKNPSDFICLLQSLPCVSRKINLSRIINLSQLLTLESFVRNGLTNRLRFSENQKSYRFNLPSTTKRAVFCYLMIVMPAFVHGDYVRILCAIRC